MRKILKEIAEGIAVVLAMLAILVLLLNIHALAADPGNPISFTAPSNEYSWIFRDMTEDEYRMLGAMARAEAESESFEGQVAVVEVCLNRVNASTFPNSVSDVLLQKGQYATRKYIKSGKPMQTQIDAIEYVREHGRTVTQPDTVYFSRKKVNGTGFWRLGNHWFSQGRTE